MLSRERAGLSGVGEIGIRFTGMSVADATNSRLPTRN